MSLKADQAVQEARFAGACQDQDAGRPVPSLGWPGEGKSSVQQARKANSVAGSQGPRAWGRALGAQATTTVSRAVCL